jgi:hypothetical protein
MKKTRTGFKRIRHTHHDGSKFMAEYEKKARKMEKKPQMWPRKVP